jgi:hypothetical protein
MNIGKLKKTTIAIALAFLASGGLAYAQSQSYYPPSLASQVRGLTVRADALGFHIGDSPDPTMCYHYQAVTRLDGPGQPYLIVNKSGNFPGPICLNWCGNIPCTDVGDEPGSIQIVRMGTRDHDGERMRSNRIVRNYETGNSVPDSEDVVVKTITLDGTGGWPSYGHPGGMQVIGDVLAVALEHPYDAADADANLNRIMFIDMSNPEDPQFLSAVPINIAETFTAGVVAITRQPNGIYLMIVTGKEGDAVKVYESYPNRDDGTTDLKDPDLAFSHKVTWHPGDDPVNPPCISIPPTPDFPGYTWGWPEGGTLDYAAQNLSFIREGGPNGPLFLLATRNSNGLPGIFGEDWVDLYSVSWDGTTFGLGCAAQRHVDTHAASDGALVFETKIADFGAAAGTYVSPTGELIIYGAEHDNDGPSGTVKAAEFRLRDHAYFGSPTYDPTVEAGGPYSVPEGSSSTLVAVASPPRNKAWTQLYADEDFSRSDRYLVVDYPDWTLDNIDDFENLDDANNNPFADGFSDQVTSVRWFAPLGCTMRLNDHDYYDDDFPGQTLTLAGTGQVETIGHLDDYDFDDEITSMQFMIDCNDYYDPSTLSVGWDMNGDSVYEVSGKTVAFSAATIDGPSSATAGARVVHPTDQRVGFDTAAVTITNVAPIYTANAVVDAAGRVLGVDTDYALLGIPLTLTAKFVDPGVADTQDGWIDWGNGESTLDEAFDTFVQATGGVEGRVAEKYRYVVPNDYSLSLYVLDDDEGLSAWGQTVRIQDARAAMLDVVADLDALLATATGAGRKALLDARSALNGPPDGSSRGGAIDKLDQGIRDGAVLKILAAVDALTRAETATGLDLDDLQATLAMAGWSIAVEAQAKAVAAHVPPSPGVAKQLATIQADLDAGETLLAAGNWSQALTKFLAAASRSVSLL